MTQPTYISNQLNINLIYLWFLRYNLDKILKVKVTKARPKIKSRLHHDLVHLHPQNQCSYPISTSSTLWFLRYSQKEIFFPATHPAHHLPVQLDAMGENNSPITLNACGVEMKSICILTLFGVFVQVRYLSC